MQESSRKKAEPQGSSGRRRCPALWIVLSLGVLLLSGCRSRWIGLTITNTGTGPIRNLELAYPGGTFGASSIAPDSSFRYRLKVTRDGPMKLTFLEPDGREHHENGPAVHVGDEGEMTVTIDKEANNTWKMDLHPR